MHKENNPRNVRQIQKNTDKHAGSELYSIHGVSCSSFYKKWLKRIGQLNRYEKANQILDKHVKDIHSQHFLMGYRQINLACPMNRGSILKRCFLGFEIVGNQ